MKIKKLFFSIIIILLMFCLLLYPKEMLEAASKGIVLWFHSVLPSLFPFMVGVSLLLNLGAADLLGHILEPIMRPLFHISGTCSFPVVMGFLSGYPMGAKIVTQLEQDGTISIQEAQKTLSFCNNPGPLFVIGTTATAMLQCPYAGYFMMLCIFLGSITTGFIFRFYGKKQPQKTVSSKYISSYNNNSIGTLLGKSVFESMETVVQIGGFVILFSVIIQALEKTNIISFISEKLVILFPNASYELISGIFCGILEMTNGANIISNSNHSLFIQILFITAILSFGGFSILAQTLSILSNSSIHTGIYILSKICNSFFSASYVFILYPFFQKTIQKTVPTGNIVLKGTVFDKESALLCILFLFICLFFYFFTKLKRTWHK